MTSKILLVDDEQLIVRTVSLIFSVYGYTVETALSGEEAIAKASSTCPDLLLADIRLPGINGFETALRIKEFCPRCRLLFFSGYVDSTYPLEDIAHRLARHGHELKVLPKPIHPQTLLRSVQRALEIA